MAERYNLFSSGSENEGKPTPPAAPYLLTLLRSTSHQQSPTLHLRRLASTSHQQGATLQLRRSRKTSRQQRHVPHQRPSGSTSWQCRLALLMTLLRSQRCLELSRDRGPHLRHRSIENLDHRQEVHDLLHDAPLLNSTIKSTREKNTVAHLFELGRRGCCGCCGCS